MTTHHPYTPPGRDEQDYYLAQLFHDDRFRLLYQRLGEVLRLDDNARGTDLQMEAVRFAFMRRGADMVFEEVAHAYHALYGELAYEAHHLAYDRHLSDLVPDSPACPFDGLFEDEDDASDFYDLMPDNDMADDIEDDLEDDMPG